MKKSRNGFIKNLHYLCLMGVVALGLMTIVATGGGGGGGGGAPPASQITLADLVGTYRLTAFTVTYDVGITITQDNVSSYSGTMLITSEGYVSQTLELNGVVATLEATILSVGPESVRVFTPECTYDLLYERSGNIFTTTFPSGTCGANYSEVDVWEKTSSSAALSKADELAFQEGEEIEEAIPGGVAGAIWNFLP